MPLLELDLHPDRTRLRRFGAIALLVLGLLAAKAAQQAGLGAARLPLALGLAGLGLLSGLFALLHPRANRPLYIALSVLAFPAGVVLSYLALLVLFFLVLGPVALMMKLTRRDPLKRRFDRAADSYFGEPDGARRPDSYFRQY